MPRRSPTTATATASPPERRQARELALVCSYVGGGVPRGSVHVELRGPGRRSGVDAGRAGGEMEIDRVVHELRGRRDVAGRACQGIHPSHPGDGGGPLILIKRGRIGAGIEVVVLEQPGIRSRRDFLKVVAGGADAGKKDVVPED